MRTPRQLAASRRNGTKSVGPKTPEGKSRSARNAITHGLNSSVVLLGNEDSDALARLEAIYKDHWNPATPAEADLVADLVNARWRLHRLLSVESASLDLEMTRRRSEVDAEFAQSTPLPAPPLPSIPSPTTAAASPCSPATKGDSSASSPGPPPNFASSSPLARKQKSAKTNPTPPS